MMKIQVSSRQDRRIHFAILVAKERIGANRVIIVVGHQAVGQEIGILATSTGGRFLHMCGP